MYIVSGCLLGEKCKYNGESNYSQEVVDFCKTHSYISVCPEVLGSMPVPRHAAEIIDGRVIDKSGSDVTEAFLKGAEISLEKALTYAEELGEEIEGAILQPRSPSCGSGRIYDGTFSGVLIDGNGCFATRLIENGITVKTDKEI